MKGKFGVIDVLVLLLLVGSFYVYQNKETYFEIKSGDILGASATYYTLTEKGLCADASVKGYLNTGELEVVSGKVVDATRSKLYIFDGNKVWVIGGEEVVLSPRFSTGESVPADLVPFTITLRAAECTRTAQSLDVDFEGLKSSGGLLSFQGIKDFNGSGAKAFWMMRKVSAETSGEVFVWSGDGIMHVYVKHIVPADVFTIEEYIPGLLVSDVVSVRIR